jgi:hypothetical protein
MSKIHFVIPDTQVTPESNLAHLAWIGQYLVDQFSDKDVDVIHLGDHWDMPSLSSYDRGKRAMEGRRYVDDIEAGNRGIDILMKPLEDHQLRRRVMKHKVWDPGKHYLDGNHDDRITRATEDDAVLDGALTLEDRNLAKHGFQVHPFLEVVDLDGIKYAHYFVNNASGRPLSGMIETRIKNVGCSFTMGHQQGLKMGMLETISGRRRGLIAGSCYLDDMDYRGPQGRSEWRGIIICHEVSDGDYCLMEVSLAWLCQKYEGVTLDKFLGRSN